MLSIPYATLVTIENKSSGDIAIITTYMANIWMFSVLWVLTYVVKNDSALVGIVV